MLSLEDVVIAKIGAFRPKDRNDIESDAVINRISFEKLLVSASEIELITYGERSWNEFKSLYNRYIEVCEEKLKRNLEVYWL